MLKIAARKLFGAFGLGIHRIGQRREAYDISELPEVDVVFDIGVADGTPWLYRQRPSAELHLFDPLDPSPALQQALSGRKYTFHRCALGSSPGELAFQHNIDQPSRSSLLSRTALTATNQVYEEVVVEVRTLDGIVSAELPHLQGKRIGLKVDTEGYELEVLRGAVQTLGQCEFVICEASIAKRFNDSYRFEELVVFMADHGFTVHSLLAAEPDGSGIIRFVDIVFLRRA